MGHLSRPPQLSGRQAFPSVCMGSWPLMLWYGHRTLLSIEVKFYLFSRTMCLPSNTILPAALYLESLPVTDSTVTVADPECTLQQNSVGQMIACPLRFVSTSVSPESASLSLCSEGAITPSCPKQTHGKFALTHPTNQSPYPTNFYSSCQSLTFHLCPVPSWIPASIHVLPLSLLFSYQVQPPSCRFSVLRRAVSLRPRHKERKPPKPLGYLCCLRVNPSYLDHFPGVFIHCPLVCIVTSPLYP